MNSDLFDRLRRRELPAAELLAALRHMSACPACSVLAEESFHGDVAALHEALRSATPTEHPDPEQELIPYVDGTADAATREIVEGHLEECDLCRAEVADLRAFARELKPRRTMVWLAVAAALAVLIAIAVMMGTRRRIAPNEPPVASTTATVPSIVPERPPYANARWAALVDEAVRGGRLPFPKDLDALRGSEDPLRGSNDGEHFRLSPTGIVIDETRPRFFWPVVDDATYVVSIFDNEDRVARSEPLRRTEWTPPRDLPRGRTLVWQVEASHDGVVDLIPAPPAPQAMFRIAGEREHAELAEAKRDANADPLLLAVLYARAGLRDDALRELRRVDLARHPEAARLVGTAQGRPAPISTKPAQ